MFSWDPYIKVDQVGVKSSHKRHHFKMESGQPFQRNCLLHLVPWIFGIFELGKVTSGLGHSNTAVQTTICKLIGKQTSWLQDWLEWTFFRISNQPYVAKKVVTQLLTPTEIPFLYSCHYFPFFSYKSLLPSPCNLGFWICVPRLQFGDLK